MTNNVIPIVSSAEAHARAETERKRQLFAWADRILQELGLVERVKRATNLYELHKVVFDTDAAEVVLAIREALHPASGTKADWFVGLHEGSLKRLLKKRFEEMKKKREDELHRQGGSQGGRQQSTPDWTDDLKLDDKGGVRPILSNLILFLRHHQQWQGVLCYDEFNARTVIRRRPSWGDEAPDTPWSDHHESLTRVWFQREDIFAGFGDVGRAVQTAARSNPYHPVREYLDALVWDRRPRLDTWFATYWTAADTPYTRAIGPRFMISGVARIFEPGCKVDHTPIFEGSQGKLKSESLRALAGAAWFTDRLSPVASKDAAMEIAGVWLIEIAEMDALTRATTSAMKSYLTRRFDYYRPPYGKHLIRRQRSCIFAGTINPPIGGYLKDATGARRFWPVACPGAIDRDGIERDRDQLWAEAVVRFKAGEKWWLETPKLEALATAEQAARFKTDVWTKPIKQWLGRRLDVSVGEVLRGALGIEPRDPPDHSAEIRVSSILTGVMGFEQYLARRGSKRQRRYRRDRP
jgi:predicted P-loop ATPase